MATLAIAALGSAAGGAIGGSFLGIAASSWGYMIGAAIGSMLFGPEGTDQKGPRLKDSTYSGEVEGTDMPILWGGDRLPGKPIWIKNPPREVRKKEESGGKGGGGGSSYTSYSYFQDLALCFGEFNCPRPRRVWANQELIYDASGNNTEIYSAGFVFSWYTGTDESIDSIIEQNVGAGNSPAYLGRCYMVINDLALTEKYGNRIPVIEAELQTTGTESTAFTDYNLGDVYDAFGNMTGLRDVLRHPTDNNIIATPLISHNGYAVPVLRADMANQYTEMMWKGNANNANDIIWFSDPFEYNPAAVDSFLYSEYYSNTGGVIYQVEYPQGKTLRAIGASGYGGVRIWAESHAVVVIHVRNLSSGFWFLDKWLFAIGPSYSEGTIIESGLSNGDYAEQWCCVNYFENIFGFFAKNTTHNDRYGFFHLQYIPLGLDPTGSRIAEPLYDYFGATEHVNWSVISTRPICIEENKEVWFGLNRTSGGNMGIMCIDSEDGDVKFWYDFYESGDTSASSYWGIASGYPHLHFDPNQRRIWWSLSGTGDVGNIHVDTRNIQWYPGSSAGNAWACSYPNRNSIWGAYINNNSGTYEWVWRERRLGLVSKGTVSLATPAAAIMEACGLTASQYDVSALNSFNVGSFVHATRHSGRSDLEVILGIAQADAVQSDYKIKIIARGGTVDATVPVDDLGAQELSGEQGTTEPVTITLPMEEEVPKIFEVQYRSSDNSYTQGIAQSYIATGSTIDIKTAQLPLALTDVQAAEICERYHQQMIDPRTFEFELPIAYVFHEPTDVLEIPKNGENHRVRITQANRGVNWLIKCKGIIDNAEDQTSTAVAPGVDEFLSKISTQQIPIATLIDGPLLRDTDLDHPGPYLTSFVYSADYPNTAWHYSVDNAVFGELAAQIDQPAAGLVTNASNTSVWEEWDDLSTITVTMANDATLSSSTKSAIEADPAINAFAYGRQGRWEYLNAATVTLVTSSPNKVYELTNLLRGRRGTNNNIWIHQSKDYLIALDTTGYYRSVLQNSQIDNTIFYRQSTESLAVSDVKSIVFPVDAKQLKPYSPIQLTGTPHDTTAWAASTAYSLNDEVIGTGGDLRRYVCTTAGTSGGTEPTWNTTIGNTTSDNTVTWTTYHEYDFDMSWTRRTRRGGSLGGDNTLTDGVGGPIEEDSEEYEIDFVNSGTSAVVATKTGLTTTSYEYLGADQETDGTDSLGSFYMDVYQISATVGRGFRCREEYDRGWGHVLNAGISLGAKLIFPLDDAAGTNAKDWVSFTNKGTYTSGAVTDGVTSDNRRSMDADGTGYMKAGTNLRDLISGKSAATILHFRYGTWVANERRLSMTQGGSIDRFYFYDGSGYPRVIWRPKATGNAIGLNGPTSANYNNGRCVMVAATCLLHGSGMNLTLSINGSIQETTSGGTGHSAYASTFQNATRDANYNDTIHGTLAATPTNIPNATGGTNYVMVFDKVLSLSELRTIYLAAHKRYQDYIDNLGSLIYHNELDASGTTQTPRVGGTNFTLQTYSAQYPGCMTASEYGIYTASETTGRHAYQELTNAFKLQTFSVAFWWGTYDQYLVARGPATNVRVFSMSPRDWNNASVKKGVHIHYNTTNGLQCDIGTGGASMSNINSGSANITGATYNHICLTVDATNGVKLYVNGSSVGTPLSALTIDWTDGTANGPNPGQMYLGADNTATSITSTNLTGCRGLLDNFEFYNAELTASEVLALYNMGQGKA